MVIACLPWGWRNYTTFDALFFVRSNFGLELRMGNHPGADAAMEVMDRLRNHQHPRASEAEAAKVQAMGEVAYMRAAGREALDWMRANPATVARLTASRVAHWWLGPLYDPPHAIVTTLSEPAGAGGFRMVVAEADRAAARRASHPAADVSAGLLRGRLHAALPSARRLAVLPAGRSRCAPGRRGPAPPRPVAYRDSQ